MQSPWRQSDQNPISSVEVSQSPLSGGLHAPQLRDELPALHAEPGMEQLSNVVGFVPLHIEVACSVPLASHKHCTVRALVPGCPPLQYLYPAKWLSPNGHPQLPQEPAEPPAQGSQSPVTQLADSQAASLGPAPPVDLDALAEMFASWPAIYRGTQRVGTGWGVGVAVSNGQKALLPALFAVTRGRTPPRF